MENRGKGKILKRKNLKDFAKEVGKEYGIYPIFISKSFLDYLEEIVDKIKNLEEEKLKILLKHLREELENEEGMGNIFKGKAS